MWGLRSVSNSASGIDFMLAKVAQQFSHEFGIPVECSVSGQPFPLSQSTGHEVLMIAREGLYNSIRHAQPSKVRLTVKFEQGKLAIRIVDDGCGFDVNALSRKPENHYGLIGMRERVERIGGTFTLKSAIGEGTDITVEVPAKGIVSVPASETAL